MLFFSVMAYAETNKLQKSLQLQNNIEKSSAVSQSKIDKYAEQTKDLFDDYKITLRQTESLKVYNHHLEKLIKSQNEEMSNIQQKMLEIEDTNRGIIPLMVRMVDMLENFVSIDTPFLIKERSERVENLKSLMDRADVTVAEKYRRVMEAYQLENEYGRTIETYREELSINNEKLTVDLLRIGRVAFMYQTLDGDKIGIWNNQSKSWESLPGEYQTSIAKGISIARKQAAPDMLKIPVAAPEVVQ